MTDPGSTREEPNMAMTPGAWLDEQRVERPAIRNERPIRTKTGRTGWAIELEFVRQRSMIALAHLVAGGWHVALDRAGDGRLIRVSFFPPDDGTRS